MDIESSVLLVTNNETMLSFSYFYMYDSHYGREKKSKKNAWKNCAKHSSKGSS